MKQTNRHIPASIKRRIGNLPCVICGCEGDTRIDHIRPVARGGSNDEWNLQPLCMACNAKKKHRLTNVELRQWFEANKRKHLLLHEYRMATQYHDFYGGVSFAVWCAAKGVHLA